MSFKFVASIIYPHNDPDICCFQYEENGTEYSGIKSNQDLLNLLRGKLRTYNELVINGAIVGSVNDLENVIGIRDEWYEERRKDYCFRRERQITNMELYKVFIAQFNIFSQFIGNMRAKQKLAIQ